MARHWSILATGAIAMIILTIFGQGGIGVFVGVSIVCLIIACLLAWCDEHRRHLFSTEGYQTFTEALRHHPPQMPTVFVVYHVDFKEGRRYASELVAAFTDAGWDATIFRNPTSNYEINRYGIWIWDGPPEARDSVIAAFKAIEVMAKTEPPQKPWIEGKNKLDITIGSIRTPLR